MAVLRTTVNTSLGEIEAVTWTTGFWWWAKFHGLLHGWALGVGHQRLMHEYAGPRPERSPKPQAQSIYHLHSVYGRRKAGHEAYHRQAVREAEGFAMRISHITIANVV